ncbi:MAG TPA: hypothetical protein VKE40_18950 [Gemmataceae bacterium]|nr:hypothetical protein [Gemmataceae bacterium]
MGWQSSTPADSLHGGDWEGFLGSFFTNIARAAGLILELLLPVTK